MCSSLLTSDGYVHVSFILPSSTAIDSKALEAFTASTISEEVSNRVIVMPAAKIDDSIE